MCFPASALCNRGKALRHQKRNPFYRAPHVSIYIYYIYKHISTHIISNHIHIFSTYLKIFPIYIYIQMLSAYFQHFPTLSPSVIFTSCLCQDQRAMHGPWWRPSKLFKGGLLQHLRCRPLPHVGTTLFGWITKIWRDGFMDSSSQQTPRDLYSF